MTPTNDSLLRSNFSRLMPVHSSPALGGRTADYDFDLPAELVAQQPLERRDASRLMVVDRSSTSISHRTFADIAELIQPSDVLVVNRTRVMRARLLGTRASGAPAEILILKSLGDSR